MRLDRQICASGFEDAEQPDHQIRRALHADGDADFGADPQTPEPVRQPVRLEGVPSTGPRGGGRQLDGILEHVLGSTEGYLSQVGWKYKQDAKAGQDQQFAQTLQASIDALRASARGDIPARGPRGGVRWSEPESAAYRTVLEWIRGARLP